MARQGLDRAQVVEAAALYCDRHGWDALNLHALASHLQVRPPSLYNHVDGLPALRRQLAELAQRELHDRFLVAAAGKNGAAGLRALAHAYREFARERPGIYPGVMAGRAPDHGAAPAPSDAVVAVVAAVMAPYALAPNELVHAIRAFRSALHGFVTLEEAHGFGLPQKIDESFARLLEILILGIEAMAKRR